MWWVDECERQVDKDLEWMFVIAYFMVPFQDLERIAATAYFKVLS
jgi:hypothetical protein